MAAHQLQQINIDDLMRAAEQHHDQYIQTLRGLQNVVGQKRRERSDSRTSVPEAMTPPMRAVTQPTFVSPEPATSNNSHQHHHGPMLRKRRSTLEATTERPISIYPSPRPIARSTISNDSAFLPDEELNFIPLLDSTSSRRPVEEPASIELDITPRTQKPLTPMSFPDEMLIHHLRDAEFDEPMSCVLEEVLRRRPDIDMASPFRDFASFERESYVSTTFEVYEVNQNATVRKTSLDIEMPPYGSVKYSGDGPLYESPDGIVDAPTVWEAIKDVNIDGNSVGRITIVQEPTPLMLAALHLTMAPHFDMAELLSHLVSDIPNRGRTHASMHRAFERPLTSSPHIHSLSMPEMGTGDHKPYIPVPLSSVSNVRQRSFFFAFKYYTSVADGFETAPWQRFDKRPSDKRLGDHIDIAECSSVLALSLGGEPTKSLRMRPRRERIREGFLFDTFGPWHLLSIQSFPDDQHTVRGDEFQQKNFYNGPYAFLDLLISEYRDAGRRNQILHEKITKLITPPTEFMFDRRLRDKLLFEDKHFTYIRRYFWAYNTLAVINTGIKAMVNAYFETFNADFWAGTHPLLWPQTNAESAEGVAYREKLALLRRDLEKVVTELEDVLNRNVRTRKEIENLRDQLFSGSSIKESRRAIDQGDNIRILTMISMIFLPLTFVTSVFGITEFTIPATDWRFSVVMCLVCIPFMALIALLQTRLFTVVVRKSYHLLIQLWTIPYRLVTGSVLDNREQDINDNRSTVVQVPTGRKRRLMAAVNARAGGAGGRWKWPWMRRYTGETETKV